MASDRSDDEKALQHRGPRAFQALRDAVRGADEWPVAGLAVRRFQDAESWALGELKQRMDSLAAEPSPARASMRSGRDEQATPQEMAESLLRRSRGINPDAARDDLYRQTLARLVPDQMAMIAVLATKGVAPLCHVAAARLPAGPTGMTVLANASSLGREAGILLREHAPHYMTDLLALGVVEQGPGDEKLADEYELLMADTQLRTTCERIRSELKLYPRIQRQSVRLSAYGNELWAACAPKIALRGPRTP